MMMDLKKLDMDRVMEAVQDDEMVGFCIACGEESDSGVEPDARKYECSFCGKKEVYGATEILLSFM